MAQAVLRIGQQAYITKRFYGHEESLGRQAQRAGDEARELAKKDGGGGGLFGQAKRDADPEGRRRRSRRRRAPALEAHDAPEGRPTPTGKTPARPADRAPVAPAAAGPRAAAKRRR